MDASNTNTPNIFPCRDVVSAYRSAKDSAPMPPVVPSAEAVTPGAKAVMIGVTKLCEKCRRVQFRCQCGAIKMTCHREAEISTQAMATANVIRKWQDDVNAEGSGIWILPYAVQSIMDAAELRLATMAAGGTP